MEARLLAVRCALVSAAIAAGCSVTLKDEVSEPSAANVCSRDVECGVDGVCVDGSCLARRGTIDDVLLEVVPDTLGGFAPDSGLQSLGAQQSLSFLIPESGIAGSDRARLVRPPAVSKFSGKVQTQLQYASGCPSVGLDPVDIAARVTFTRTGVLNGVPVTGVQLMETKVESGAEKMSFSTSLLAGTYDVYVEPACPAAPLLISGLEVGPEVDASKEPAVLTLQPPIQLVGTVKQKDNALSGWEISLIEPQQRRRISTVQKLGSGNMTNFSILYQSVISADGRSPSSPLIQISPPDPTGAPTIYWVLWGVDITGTNKIGVDATGVPTNAIQISGQLKDPDQGSGVAGVVFFFSSKLEGSSGITANFKQRVSTDQMGHYIVGLLPGDYRVVAIPGVSDTRSPTTDGPDASTVAWSVSNTPWAITERLNTFRENGPSSFDIQLDRKVTLTGTATLAPNGRPALGAWVQVTPTTLPSQSGVLLDAFAQTAVLPLAPAPVQVDADGGFQVSVDPGTYDVSIRPDTNSNLAWWVRPAVEVGNQPPPIEAVLPLPVALDGQVVDGATGMGRALVRAFAATPDRKMATQVGLTHTDANGNFRLRVPSAIAADQ